MHVLVIIILTDDELVSECVVLDLTQPYYGLGHVVYLDNWYESPLFFCKTSSNNIHSVTKKKKEMKNASIVQDNELRKNEEVARSSKYILVVLWKYHKDVFVLTRVEWIPIP